MSIGKKLKLPKEHGAWAMLYVPLVLGLAIAAKLTVAAIFLFICVTTLFISRESLLVWLRAKRRARQATEAGKLLLMYVLIAALSGLPLLLFWKYYWLIPLGIIGVSLLALNGVQGSQLAERSVVNELLAIAGLTMSAPAAYTVSLGAWNFKALWLWGFCVLYFASSVFFIKHSLYSVHGKTDEQRAKAKFQCGLYHGFLLTGLVALTVFFEWPLVLLLAFVPILVRALRSVIRPPEKINLRRVGMTELFYSIIFLVFVTYTFWQRV